MGGYKVIRKVKEAVCGDYFLYGHRIIYILVGFYYRNPRARSQAGDFFDPRLSELCISYLINIKVW